MLGKFAFANLTLARLLQLQGLTFYFFTLTARRCTTVMLNARRLTGRNTVMIVKLGVSEGPRDFTYKMKEPGDKQVEEEEVDCYSIVAIQHYIHLIHSLQKR